MLLKGAMRERQAPERWCLAEERHGESPEARIALRETRTLTYLACDVSQENSEIRYGESKSQRGIGEAYCNGHTGQPGPPCVNPGQPQRAEGAASNAPPTSFQPVITSYTTNTGSFLKDDKESGQ